MYFKRLKGNGLIFDYNIKNDKFRFHSSIRSEGKMKQDRLYVYELNDSFDEKKFRDSPGHYYFVNIFKKWKKVD